jgi:PAS domain S-box-containing protein
VLIRDGEGAPDYWLGVKLDVGDRQAAEAALRASEARFRSLIANATDLIAILDADGTVRYQSPPIARILGYGAEELVGRNAFDLVHPDDRAATWAAFAAAVADPACAPTVEFRFRHQDGSWRWLESTVANLLADPDVAGVVVNARDVTERKRAEAQRERQARLAALRADVGAALADPDDLGEQLRRCAAAIARHLGAARATVWLLDEAGEALELAAGAGPFAAPGGGVRVPVGGFRVGRVAQERRPLLNNDLAADRLDGDKDWASRGGLASFAGYPLLLEDRLVGVVAMFARRPLAGDALAALGTVADVLAQGIERRRAEAALRVANAELARLNRVMGDFVATVAHEFRTPLTSIQGFSELIRDGDLPPAEVREFADDVNRNARRLGRLIGELLDVDRLRSGRIELRREPVDLNAAAAEVAETLRPTAPDHALRLDLDPALPPVPGDRDRLVQVLTNLVDNAIKYSPQGGDVVVETRRVGEEARLAVRDRGVGIAPEALETVFERYARVGSGAGTAIPGTGLGLPIAREIVALHGGRIWAESEPGQGTTFHVIFPLAGAPAAP